MDWLLHDEHPARDSDPDAKQYEQALVLLNMLLGPVHEMR